MTDPPNHRVPPMATHTPGMDEPQQLRRQAPKDLSLVTLVPKWSGTETASPLVEFFEAIEGTARIGNWSEADQIQICALRLTETARAFYSATPELRDPSITWQDFKASFFRRFRDVRTDQFHFTQLQQARQRSDETPSEFLDRVKILARRTMPCATDEATRKVYAEQADRMLLAAFTTGLKGNPGKEVRYRNPETAEEALRIAITVAQADIQERRNNSFQVGTEVDITPSGRVREQVNASTKGANFFPARQFGQASQRYSTRQRSASKEQVDALRRCYECNGHGHFARDCANRKQRIGDSNAGKKGRNGDGPDRDRGQPKGRDLKKGLGHRQSRQPEN